MAWMNQERKAKIAANLKPVLKKYGVKGSLRVRNHMAIVFTVKSGPIDFIANCNEVCGRSQFQRNGGFRPIKEGYCDVNSFWFQEHFDGVAKDFLTEAFAALKSADYYDRSDAMTDYFDTAYYFDLNIGTWQKPYVVTK
jgi:hypothetical protein